MALITRLSPTARQIRVGISLIDAEVPNECTSVTLDFEDNMLKAYLRSERKCVAMYTSEELHRLVTEYAVTLTATVCGTPVQNRLEDFGALLEFVGVPPFSQSSKAFENYVSGPVNAKEPNSLALLRAVVAATCLRRTNADHASTLNLPTKRERIEWVEMTPEDRSLYDFLQRFAFAATTTRKPTTVGEGYSMVRRRGGYTSKKQAGASTNILALISMLRLTCDHGEALLPALAQQAWHNRDPALLSWSIFEKEAGLRRCAACDSKIEDADTVGPAVEEELACGHVLCESCSLTMTQTSESQSSCPKCGETIEKEQRSPSLPSGADDTDAPQNESPIAQPQYPPSAKLRALLHNLTKGLAKSSTSETRPNKCVVFSSWTKMLDLIAVALREKGVDFCRIDGWSTLSQRGKALDRFGKDPACTIVLASIGAAGEGIDLTAANSVHIVEPHWNPMAEEQAISRIHRARQDRDVEVIRYVVRDSIKNYVRWVQDHKLKLIDQALASPGADAEEVGIVRYKAAALHVNADQPNHADRTPLGDAAEPIRLFLQFVRHVDTPDARGVRPLHLASTQSEVCVGELLAASADPEDATLHGLTPLHLAARARQSNIVGRLLDPIRNWGGSTATPMAVCTVDEVGWQLLHYACRSGRPETVALLLEFLEAGGIDAGTLPSMLDACAESAQEQPLWESYLPQWVDDTSSMFLMGLERGWMNDVVGGVDRHDQLRPWVAASQLVLDAIAREIADVADEDTDTARLKETLINFNGQVRTDQGTTQLRPILRMLYQPNMRPESTHIDNFPFWSRRYAGQLADGQTAAEQP
ncbi:hypothetical protein Sste5344_003719 [Sporothrix stenoceras]